MVPLGRIFRLGVELYTSRSRQDAYAVQTMHVTSVYYVCCRVGACATDRWQSTFLAAELHRGATAFGSLRWHRQSVGEVVHAVAEHLPELAGVDAGSYSSCYSIRIWILEQKEFWLKTIASNSSQMYRSGFPFGQELLAVALRWKDG